MRGADTIIPAPPLSSGQKCRYGFSLLILLAAVLASAALAADLLQHQSEQAVEAFSKSAGLTAARQAFSPKESLKVLAQYTVAAADAMVKFEYFPKSDDNALLWIMDSIDDTISVESFEVSDRMVTIHGESEEELAVWDFYERLMGTGRFQDVSYDYFESEDGNIQFTVHCFYIYH